MAPNIYVLDDDPTFAQLLKANLGRAGEFRIQLFHHPLECLDAIAEDPPDALLTDLMMPEMSGIDVTRKVRERSGLLPIFLLTAHGEIESAIEALKAGANEYITKPVNTTELTTLLRKALETRPLVEEAIALRKRARERYSLDSIVGEHPLIEETRDFIRGVSEAANVGVLLLGESGTGKNLAARAIHYSSPRSSSRFVELNCAALPPALMEAELFGYMKGAFTDARDNKQGLVEVADGGTLFLDEIGELPLELQVKLLNFLESQRFRRLGGTREREVDVRVIAATNRPVSDLLEQNGFRRDLFYRIAVANHTLPPLREIRSDIPAIATSILTQLAAELGRDVHAISAPVIELLERWDWPGNVRELRNMLERSLIFASGPELQVHDLPSYLKSARRTRRASRFQMRSGLTLREVEREYIRLTLEATEGKVKEAADQLGISRKNLWEKRKRHGLLE